MNNILENSIKYYDESFKSISKYLDRTKKFEFKETNSDLNYPKIIFKDKNDNIILEAEFQVIAKYYVKNKVWIWSWGLPTLPKSEMKLCKKLLDYGLNITKEDMIKDGSNQFIRAILTNSRIKIENEDIDELILKSISLYLTKQICSLKIKSNFDSIFIVLTKIIKK